MPKCSVSDTRATHTRLFVPSARACCYIRFQHIRFIAGTTMRNVLLALIVAAFILGCGQKGPLYHPADKPAAKKQDKPAEQSSKDSDPKRQTQ